MKRNSLNPEDSYFPPYGRDIRNILVLYHKKEEEIFKELQESNELQSKRKNHQFSTFKEIWKEMNFYFIHRSTPENVSYRSFLQEIFTTCLGYLLPKSGTPFHLKVGAIYLLFLIFVTQKNIDQVADEAYSVNKPIELKNDYSFGHKESQKSDKREIIMIEIDQKILIELNKIRKECIAKKINNCYYIILFFLQNQYFKFNAVLEIDQNLSSIYTPFLQSTNIKNQHLLSNTVKVENLQKGTNEYIEAKNELFDGNENLPRIEESTNSNRTPQNQFNYYNIINNNFVAEISDILEIYETKKQERDKGNKVFQLGCEKKVIDQITSTGSKKDVRIIARNRKKKLGVSTKQLTNPSILSTAIDFLPNHVVSDNGMVKMEIEEPDDERPGMSQILRLENQYYEDFYNRQNTNGNNETGIEIRPYGPFKHFEFPNSVKIEENSEDVQMIESSDSNQDDVTEIVPIDGYFSNDTINSIEYQTALAELVNNEIKLTKKDIVCYAPVQQTLSHYYTARQNGEIGGIISQYEVGSPESLSIQSIPTVTKNADPPKKRKRAEFEFRMDDSSDSDTETNTSPSFQSTLQEPQPKKRKKRINLY